LNLHPIHESFTFKVKFKWKTTFVLFENFNLQSRHVSLNLFAAFASHIPLCAPRHLNLSSPTIRSTPFNSSNPNLSNSSRNPITSNPIQSNPSRNPVSTGERPTTKEVGCLDVKFSESTSAKDWSVSCTFWFESFPELKIVWERWKCCDWTKWKKILNSIGILAFEKSCA